MEFIRFEREISRVSNVRFIEIGRRRWEYKGGGIFVVINALDGNDFCLIFFFFLTKFLRTKRKKEFEKAWNATFKNFSRNNLFIKK